jgi:hypothetical protein
VRWRRRFLLPLAPLVPLVPLVLTFAVATAGPAGPALASAATSAPAALTTIAGHPCVLRVAAAPSDRARVVAQRSCPGVRPGGAVVTPLGLCTLNFLFRGSDGADYMGTAGHCVLERTAVKEAVFDAGTGPLASDVAGSRIGTFAYAALDDERDFALVRLDPGVAASPAICGYGGPTHLDTAPVAPVTALHYFAQGAFTGDLVPARALFALGQDALSVTSVGLASPGDSGGPVIRGDGGAVGLLVATGPGLPLSLLGAGLVSYTVKLAPQLDRATRATGVGYTIRTAPVREGLL